MNENDNGIVISSRVRLARNFEDFVFPSRLDDAGSAKVLEKVENALKNSDEKFGTIKLSDMSDLQAETLKELHMISDDMLRGNKNGAVVVNKTNDICIMVNEEDHLREQCIIKGLHLKNAYDRISGIDSKIGRTIKFAYDEQLGYLTACPTNLGTGMRASVMLFLPAVTLNGSMGDLVRSISRLGLTVRGIYGEGSNAEGYMYQVSNEVTLGVTEEDILSQVEEVAGQICRLEKAERKKLASGSNRLAVKDKCMRAYGVATNCAVLSSGELATLGADIKLGACLGFIPVSDVAAIDDLVARMRPYNINISAGKPLTAAERDVYRAEYSSATIKRLAGAR